MYKGYGSNIYNFVLSSSTFDLSINGILGFIPTQIYNKEIEAKKNIIWYSIQINSYIYFS